MIDHKCSYLFIYLNKIVNKKISIFYDNYRVIGIGQNFNIGASSLFFWQKKKYDT